MKNGYIAFVLDDESRTNVLKNYSPKYPNIIAHHITIIFGIPKPSEDIIVAYNLVFDKSKVFITEYVDDGKVEVLVVSINDITTRDDGKYFHLTLSIDRSKGAKPVHANDALLNSFHTAIRPIPISGKVEFIYN